MLFGCSSRERLEPVRVVSSALLKRPLLHLMRNYICRLKTQLPADLDDLAQGAVHLFRQAVTHHRIIENICAEYIRYISVSFVHISSNSLFCRNPEKTFQSPSGSHSFIN